MREKEKVLLALYNEELLHRSIYQKFAESERNRRTSTMMSKLVGLEKRHAELWGKLLDMNNMERTEYNQSFRTSFVMLSKAIFGTAVTIKIIEHMEESTHEKLNRMLGSFSKKEREIIEQVSKNEEEEEAPIEDEIVGRNLFFKNIRDVMFGMNDGLVELLAVAVGLAAALKTPLLIFLAGFIVAISGTLSMAAGAYLSTGYQKDIDEKSAVVKGTPTARSSAFYVGVFYFIGSLFPLAPFALGVVGYTGITAAIILTSIVLAITSSLIALATDKSVIRSVSKTLIISLGVAAITILLGAYIRATFHITV